MMHELGTLDVLLPVAILRVGLVRFIRTSTCISLLFFPCDSAPTSHLCAGISSLHLGSGLTDNITALHHRFILSTQTLL